MFSPYYAWSRRRGTGDPTRHCAVNVALYGRPKAWTMTERSASALQRDATRLEIGPSSLHWDGASLVIRLDEITTPLPSRLRGEIRVHPAALTRRSFVLDAHDNHRWSPIAPVARVEVTLNRPELRWSGTGYLDSNEGDAALETDFQAWDWCRAPLGEGAAILYNATRREGGDASLALRIDRHGAVTAFAPPPVIALPRTGWRLPRATRGDSAAIRTTLEDTPFYARSVLDMQILGQPVIAMHESLSLDRFRTMAVQAMLPFRMPRRG